MRPFAKLLALIQSIDTVCKSTRWSKDSEFMQIWDHDYGRYIDSLVKDYPFDCIKCRSGSSGKWASNPYCALLSAKYNGSMNGLSATVGFYPAYLLSSDNQRLYLVLMISSNLRSERSMIRITSEIVE